MFPYMNPNCRQFRAEQITFSESVDWEVERSLGKKFKHLMFTRDARSAALLWSLQRRLKS